MNGVGGDGQVGDAAHQPERTVTVAVQDLPAGADVAGQVALALAVRSGLPPLAADRLRGAVERAVAAAGTGVTVGVEPFDGAVTVVVGGVGSSALEPVAAALRSAGDVVAEGDAVRLTALRPPLASV